MYVSQRNSIEGNPSDREGQGYIYAVKSGTEVQSRSVGIVDGAARQKAISGDIE
jgi:hypothetical protein